MYYSIDECIDRYGASRYLNVLRQRLSGGSSTKVQFIFHAANAYLRLEKPLRAAALLKTIDLPALHPESQRKHQALLEKTETAIYRKQSGCSCNMIVKNESASISGALDSVDELMDEIIVCDTGSTDTTRDIAALYGATVVSIPWRNDFSAARNEAIKASTRPWIFWLDADDRLDAASRHELANLLQNASPQAASFCIINEQLGGVRTGFMQVRMFPRMDGLLFERRVHEQIMFNAERLCLPFTQYPLIRIVHKGYNDPMIQKAKVLRNLPLIAEELRDHPDDPALLLSYGDCQMALGRIDESIQIYKKIADTVGLMQKHPDVFIQAYVNIGYLYYKKKDSALAKRWLCMCLQLDGTRIEAYYLLGRIFEEEKDFEQAIDCYCCASRINPPVRQTAADSTKIKVDSIYCVVKLLFLAQRFPLAQRLLQYATAAFPQVVEFHTLLGQAMLEQKKLKEAAYSFMQSLSLSTADKKDACAGMAVIYESLNEHGKAKLFLELAKQGEP